MTPLADMIEKMTADGVPMATILLAVRTAEQVAAAGNSGGIPVDAAAEKRRAYDRERKRNKANSTGVSTGIPPEQPIALTSLVSNTPQEVIEKKEKKEGAKRKTGCVLPDEFRPKDFHYAEGRTMGRTERDVDAKVDEMRLWSKSNAHRAVARKSDWDATLTGWMRRDWSNGADNGNGPHHNRTSQAPRSGATGQDAILAGMGRLAARVAERGASERRERDASADDDAPGRRDARLI